MCECMRSLSCLYSRQRGSSIAPPLPLPHGKAKGGSARMSADPRHPITRAHSQCAFSLSYPCIVGLIQTHIICESILAQPIAPALLGGHFLGPGARQRVVRPPAWASHGAAPLAAHFCLSGPPWHCERYSGKRALHVDVVIRGLREVEKYVDIVHARVVFLPDSCNEPVYKNMGSVPAWRARAPQRMCPTRRLWGHGPGSARSTKKGLPTKVVCPSCLCRLRSTDVALRRGSKTLDLGADSGARMGSMCSCTTCLMGEVLRVAVLNYPG